MEEMSADPGQEGGYLWDSGSREASLAEQRGPASLGVFLVTGECGVSISLTCLQQVYGGPVVAGTAACSPELSSPDSVPGAEEQFPSGQRRACREDTWAWTCEKGVVAGGPGAPHLRGGTGPEPRRGPCLPGETAREQDHRDHGQRLARRPHTRQGSRGRWGRGAGALWVAGAEVGTSGGALSIFTW